MTLVRATTQRQLVRVSASLAGEVQSLVRVSTSPTMRVRVSLEGFRPVSELYTTLQFVFDGGGIPIVPGHYIDVTDVPFPCRIVNWVMTADQPSQTAVELLATTRQGFPNFDSIAPESLPSLDNVIIADGVAAADWSDELDPGDIIRATVTGNTAAQRLSLSLRVVRLSR